MPNHCEQDLYITAPNDPLGRRDLETLVAYVHERPYSAPPRNDDDSSDTPTKVVEDVVAALDEAGDRKLSVFHADSIIPYPARFRDADAAYEKAGGFGKAPPGMKDGYNSGGYQWCTNNWGSKWGAYDATLRRTHRGLTYRFTSAWSPITPVIAKLAELYPLLRFELRYFERGMEFQGVAIYEHGKLVRDVRRKYRGSRGG